MTKNSVSTLVTAKIAPAGYFPLNHGFYEVKPGLHPFGQDFGNGDMDKVPFQIDQRYAHYCQQKQNARAEDVNKYYQTKEFTEAKQQELIGFFIWRLTNDYPQWFGYEKGDHGIRLDCALSGQTLVFDKSYNLIETLDKHGPLSPPYVSSLDAIACQLQEDLAIVSLDDEGHNFISALHLCLPNYWAAEDKIGRDFATVHEPVAGIQQINNNADSIVRAMIDKGPFVRFSWGLVTDDYLNHHPQAAPGHDATLWQGRRFDVDDPKLFLRVERQTIFGFPAINSALFTIRTYLTDCRQIKRNQAKNAALISAIRSMSDDSLMYKGLFEKKQQILDWLIGSKTTTGNTATTGKATALQESQ